MHPNRQRRHGHGGASSLLDSSSNGSATGVDSINGDGNESSATSVGSGRDPPPSPYPPPRADTPGRFSPFGGVGDPSLGPPPYAPPTLPPTGAYGGHHGSSRRGTPALGSAPHSAPGRGSKGRDFPGPGLAQGPAPPQFGPPHPHGFAHQPPYVMPPLPPPPLPNQHQHHHHPPPHGIRHHPHHYRYSSPPPPPGVPHHPGQMYASSYPPLPPHPPHHHIQRPHFGSGSGGGKYHPAPDSSDGDGFPTQKLRSGPPPLHRPGYGNSVGSKDPLPLQSQRSSPPPPQDEEAILSSDERNDEVESPQSAKKEKGQVSASPAKGVAVLESSTEEPGTDSAGRAVDATEGGAGSGKEPDGVESPALERSADGAHEIDESRGIEAPAEESSSEAPAEESSSVRDENEASGAAAGKSSNGAKEKEGGEQAEEGSASLSTTLPASPNVGDASSRSPARPADAPSPSSALSLATPGRRERAAPSNPSSATTPEGGNRRSRREKRKAETPPLAAKVSVPLRSDFAFFVAEQEGDYRRAAEEEVRKAARLDCTGSDGRPEEAKGNNNVEKGEEKDHDGDDEDALDSYLLFSRLNEDLLAAWEAAPPDVRSVCRELEEEDRERVAAENEASAAGETGRRQQQMRGAVASSPRQRVDLDFGCRVDGWSGRTSQHGRMLKGQSKPPRGGDCDQVGNDSGEKISRKNRTEKERRREMMEETSGRSSLDDGSFGTGNFIKETSSGRNKRSQKESESDEKSEQKNNNHMLPEAQQLSDDDCASTIEDGKQAKKARKGGASNIRG